MIQIDPYHPDDLSSLVKFVEAIQEYERRDVRWLKPGHEIADDYAATIIRNVDEKGGAILVARQDGRTVGFVSAWTEVDEDPLLQENVRQHAYVSDLYVDETLRRNGIASKLLTEIEKAMRGRRCSRIRICSKAANRAAMECYKSAGYQPYEVIFSKELG